MSHLSPLQDPVITSEPKGKKPSFHCLSNNQLRIKRVDKRLRKQIRTLENSSRSLLGGASTFNGVIVAEATALAA
jgi:hypothetical protein